MRVRKVSLYCGVYVCNLLHKNSKYIKCTVNISDQKCQHNWLKQKVKCTLHWKHKGSLSTTCCKVWAIKPKACNPQSSIAMVIVRALSQSTKWTLSSVLFHRLNIVSNASQLQLCDPGHSCAWDDVCFMFKSSSSLWAVNLRILTGLTSEVDMSIVTYVTYIGIYQTMNVCDDHII